MNAIENIKQWVVDYPVTASVFKYILLVLIIASVVSMLRRMLRRVLPDSNVRYKSQKGVEIIGYAIIIFLTVTYFSGRVNDFALAIGLFTAGVTITLQELILSIAGSFYIFLVRVYKPGDRIEINGIKGDVIDIDSIYTTMMEIGEWVTSDNYSGRIVKLSNAFVFKGPIYNYSQDFPFVWDELDIPVRYESDVELAKSIMIKVAQEVLSEYVQQSITNWQEVVNKYYIEDANVQPTLAITMTDNWMRFNLRYIVDYKKRRTTKHLLNERIGAEVLKTNGAVKIASATIEVVRIPDIRVEK
ncbi:MAG: mechanosensitive ion channel family protein [Chitinophagales bacterium]|nr:mechanosensitive ion channel family protein [Chitinophagaceae bacterium]MCB9065850.1 mechanosensitive ion channel family protein [Chitinophagales bacterium]